MKVLTIAQAAEVLPLSKSTLYRLALSGESPFRKRGGKWMATENDLLDWVRAGEVAPRRSSGDPMPASKGKRRPAMMELVNR